MNRTLLLITKAHGGDKASEEILIEENMPLVHSCVRKLWKDNLEYDDLLQLGSIGLVKAIRRFDMGFGVAFSTYAVPLIMGEIRRHLRDDGIIKVSRNLKEIRNKALKLREELYSNLKREPRINEIANIMGIDTEKLTMALEAGLPCESLQKEVQGLDSELTLADTLADTKSFNDEFEKISLKTALSALGERQRKIVILRYFRGKTQAEVSSMVGVSQVQVSRIEKKVLSTLRNILE